MHYGKIILKVVHGSYLYGLDHPQSDRDYYQVYDFPWKLYRPRQQSHHIIDTHGDTTTVSLEKFTDSCIKGVPQSLEALFSDSSKWLHYDNSWYDKSKEIKTSLASNIPSVLETYRRTAWSFFLDDHFKKNRHALRLCLNAKDLKAKGSFDPTLKPDVREEITRIANLPRRQREEIFKDVFYDTFGDL